MKRTFWDWFLIKEEYMSDTIEKTEKIVGKDLDYIEGICGVCPGNCAVRIGLNDGKIQTIQESEENPHSCICLRGSKAKDIVYSEDRLTKPLIRTGPKGTYEFKEASWDEALQYAADGFNKIKEKYGAQALASHHGRGAFEQPFSFFESGIGDNDYGGFFGNIGSPNVGGVSSLCYVSYGLFAPVPTMGIPSANIQGDFENSNVIFVWGSNPPVASPPVSYRRIKEARKNGAKVITVDHYKSIMAKNSDDYVIVNSGTDGALILGLINYLIKENKYDKDFVKNYTYGFEDLKEYVREFSLNKVIDICGISEEDFHLIADNLIKEKVSLETYTGLEYSNCGVQTIRSIYMLWAITGHLDEKGGLIVDKPRSETYKIKEDIGEDKIKPVGYDEFPLFCDMTGQMQFTKFPQAVLEEKPYKVAGLLNIGSVISINYPSSSLYEKALGELEMFVTADRFLSKDALYADVVLPATSYFEDKSFVIYNDMVRIRDQVIEKIGESRSNVAILRALAEKMGFGDKYPKDSDEMIKIQFKNMPGILEKLKENPQGVKIDQDQRQYRKYESGGLRSDGEKGFPTESAKFEFKSKMLESYGFDGLPIFVHAEEGRIQNPSLAEEYPLILNTGARIQSTFRTQHLNIDSLVKIQEAPHIIINTKDAKERGIQSGDEVIVSSPRGQIKVVADVVDGINPGDTELNIGGGQEFQKGLWKDANTNYLTDIDNHDPISGFPIFKNLLCQVSKA